MFRLIVTSAILLSSASAFLPCRQAFRAVDRCHNQNPECRDCKILAFSNPFAVGFCDAVNDSICNALNCCEPCTDEFIEYETCIEGLTFGGCQFDCDIAPTPPPSPAPTTAAPSVSLAPSTEEEKQSDFADELEGQGCLDKFGDFAACVAANPLLCGSCFISSIPDDMDEGFCTSAENTICGFGTCCEPCLDEFIEFDDCFEDVVEKVTFGLCDIDCDGFEPPENPPLDPACVEKVNLYTDCVADNPIECATCAVLNFPVNPGEAGFCEIATESLCGFSQCCSSCETEFQEADECVESYVSLATFGECEIDCDAHDNGGGDLSNVGACATALREYTSCVANYPLDCAFCFITNLPRPGDDEFCEAAGDSVCGFGNCCAPCSEEFDNFDECFEMFASVVTAGSCQIDCDAEEGGIDRALRGIREV